MKNRLMIFGLFVLCLFLDCVASDKELSTNYGKGYAVEIACFLDTYGVPQVSRRFQEGDTFIKLKIVDENFKSNDADEKHVYIDEKWLNNGEKRVKGIQASTLIRSNIKDMNSGLHETVLIRADEYQKKSMCEFLHMYDQLTEIIKKKSDTINDMGIQLINEKNHTKEYKKSVAFLRKCACCFFLCTVGLAGLIGYILLHR